MIPLRTSHVVFYAAVVTVTVTLAVVFGFWFIRQQMLTGNDFLLDAESKEILARVAEIPPPIDAGKVEAALRAGLRPIICVGETLEEREAGWAIAVVTGQVEDSLPQVLEGRDFAVAYEPVWAIGSGLTPTIEQIVEIHTAIRGVLKRRFGASGEAAPILYGGSVKPANAVEILAADEVGGALVGGASLKAADFLPIIRAV